MRSGFVVIVRILGVDAATRRLRLRNRDPGPRGNRGGRDDSADVAGRITVGLIAEGADDDAHDSWISAMSASVHLTKDLPIKRSFFEQLVHSSSVNSRKAAHSMGFFPHFRHLSREAGVAGSTRCTGCVFIVGVLPTFTYFHGVENWIRTSAELSLTGVAIRLLRPLGHLDKLNRSVQSDSNRRPEAGNPRFYR